MLPYELYDAHERKHVSPRRCGRGLVEADVILTSHVVSSTQSRSVASGTEGVEARTLFQWRCPKPVLSTG